jgi:hypothetical protein
MSWHFLGAPLYPVHCFPQGQWTFTLLPHSITGSVEGLCGIALSRGFDVDTVELCLFSLVASARSRCKNSNSFNLFREVRVSVNSGANNRDVLAHLATGVASVTEHGKEILCRSTSGGLDLCPVV